MARIGTQDPNYDWAQKHIADFERYLTEQCQPYFEEVAAKDTSKFMAPMWWSVGYVILRGPADKQSVSPDDTDTLIDRAMLLLDLLPERQHPVFHEIRDRFVLPMAKSLKIHKDNGAVNQHIFKRIVFVVYRLRDGETLTVPAITGSGEILIERQGAAPTAEDNQIQGAVS